MGRGNDAPADRAYDLAIAVESDDEDEELSTPASSDAGSPAKAQHGQVGAGASPQQSGPDVVGSMKGRGGDDASDSGESSSSESGSSTSESSAGGEKKGGQSGGMPQSAYNPDDFKNMKVSAEVEELFQYITRYKPHTIELDTSLKPFVPELIPSIGEVDAVLKMPRPDGAPCGLGTTRLDEPTLTPSDPSILDLQLRSLSKNQDLEPMEVRSIENAEKCPKEVENWVRRIDDLNRSKPAPTVQYTRRMPDIEQLMQVWPAEFEEHLQQEALPDLADIDLDLPSYIRILASILDVPVNNQITESLHVIFTLYSEFRMNQHFSKAEQANFGQADPYNFDNLSGGPTASQAVAAMATLGLPTESIAPSRAPSPVGK
eukprot:TRINITY_DN31138_c0_g1_i1.p1 TRINITY_DN31138_c0_g1~~TRINITY_DN31138_c0_g1_i1.p1  ORF type:complete len:394 (+),score=91.86 TRINITY_DN31138_c0_g1_i1:62-1183(+)